MIEHFDKNYIDEAVRRKIIDDDKNAAHFKYVRRNWLSGKIGRHRLKLEQTICQPTF